MRILKTRCFAKKKIANVSKTELGQLKILASMLMNYNNHELQKALDENELIEVTYHD